MVNPFLAKAWMGIKIFSVIFLFGTIILGIIDGAVLWKKTGDARPFMDATAGKALAADTAVGLDVQYLIQSENLDKKFVDYLKADIMQNVAIILFMWYILFKLLHLIRKLFLSDEQMNLGLSILIGILALVLFMGANFFFTKWIYGVWEMPFHGMISLITNFGAVSSAVGLYTNPLLINETINQTTNMINLNVTNTTI